MKGKNEKRYWAETVAAADRPTSAPAPSRTTTSTSLPRASPSRSRRRTAASAAAPSAGVTYHPVESAKCTMDPRGSATALVS